MLGNLVDRLAEHGVLFLHVCGEDYHRWLQIEEILNLVSPPDNDPKTRFALFEAYARHWKRLQNGSPVRRLYRLSLRDIVLGVRDLGDRWIRSFADDEWSLHAWRSELETPTYSERWQDQFYHSNERTYNLNELCALLDGVGLEPIEMFSLGKTRPEHLPPEWRGRFENLDTASRCRLMELLNPFPTSPFVAARKKR